MLVRVVSNHRLGLIVKRLQAALDRLQVVVHTTRRLASIHQPLRHGLIVGVNVQNQLAFGNLVLVDLEKFQRYLNKCKVVSK